ncbi:MAG: hypothetical protein AAB840_00310 [Patescibacteria group bacterium]
MKKITFIILILMMVLVSSVLLPSLVFATSHGDTAGGTTEGIPLSLNPLKGGVDTLMGLLTLVVDAVMYIAVPVIIILFIYAGLKFVMARGVPAEIDKAKEMFKWLVIGSAIILGAKLLISILENTINSLKP